MAISILIADPSEAEQVVAIGLDLARKLDSPLAILCLAPSPDQKPTGKLETQQAEADVATPASFVCRVNYTEHVTTALCSRQESEEYRRIAVQVFEVPPSVKEIRNWHLDPPHTDTLGRFDVETLFIPMRRDEGDEGRREAKLALFSSIQCEAALVAINQDQTAPLRLAHFACLGSDPKEARRSRRFAWRFRTMQSTTPRWEQGEESIDCAVLTERIKTGQNRIASKLWPAMRRDTLLQVAVVVNPADSLRERVFTRLDSSIQAVFAEYQMKRKDRERLATELTSGTHASPEFLLFMALATLLASIGLLQDSPAVIIGAMLVAPLMTPLLGGGLAMIQGNQPLFLTACRAILIGVCLSFSIGAFMGLFSGLLPAELFAGSELRLTGAMIARSQPNLLDPLIGFAAGLAGGFSVGRDKKIGTLAGVAIAAALVPPIATAGIETAIIAKYAATQHGLFDALQLIVTDPGQLLAQANLFTGDLTTTRNVHLVIAPLALFGMNACTVILGTFLGLRLVGMHRTMYPKLTRRWVSLAALGIVLALLLLLMLVPVVDFYLRR